MRNRNFLITCWKKPDFSDERITYYIYQKEECPTTKKIHYQCYIEVNEGISIENVKKIIYDKQAHIEPRYGTQQEAIDYCSKRETQVEEPISHGTPKKQGKRNDIEFGVNSVQEGKEIVDIIIEQPGLLRYINHLEKFKCMYDAKYNKRTEAPIVEVLIGEPGSGKTREVVEKEPDLYIVQEASSSQFFDGYNGQKAVLFDDFKGNIRFNFMLQLLDRYNIRVNTKGGTTMWRPERIYITSNYEPHEWYINSNAVDKKALYRRLNKITQKSPGNTIQATMDWE